MPAAAVIPAPIAYIKVVAVKKLVVGFLFSVTGPPLGWYQVRSEHSPGRHGCASLHGLLPGSFTLRKLECFTQALALNTLAWNNTIGPWFCLVGFWSRGND